jgi:hypothetical protein
LNQYNVLSSTMMLPSNLLPLFSFRFFAWSRDCNPNIT